jgi:hypothetical protein
MDDFDIMEEDSEEEVTSEANHEKASQKMVKS